MDSANPVTSGQARSAAALPDGSARPHGREAWQRSVPRVFLEPSSRAAWGAAWRQCVYVVAGLLLAIPGFVFIVVVGSVGLGLSLSFAGMLIGLPLLTLFLLGARWFGGVYRHLAGRLLGVHVSNGAIAGILVVSERAVEKHIANIFSKLGLAPSDADHRRVLAVLRYLGS